MSANLYWEPVERRKNSISTTASSSFMEKMRKVFGSETPSLDVGDLQKLETLRDLDDGYQEAFQELIAAIEKCGSIKISAQY